ncbi:response regulator [Microbacterium sp. NPDC077184]|uniref:response regulator n=1 Tax=Microbacterium sp. NPDC077184 TaxID=3154764 RepID=UPI0034239EF3
MIRVLLVDDETLTLELHRGYIDRIEGFEVVAECSGARAAVAAVLEEAPGARVDLILLDMTMPDGSGLDVLRHLRAHGAEVDVIAITSVRDADVVRQAISLGATHYLVKPFTFAALHERLEQYRLFHRRATDAAGPATQAEIDALLGASRPVAAVTLPKGLSATTLARVRDDVRGHDGAWSSATEIAERLGMSRVAARRYLEHLVEAGRIERGARYGTPGRPESEYRWRR